MYSILIIRPDWSVEHIRQPKKPELNQLQEAVGGYIQECLHFTRMMYKGIEYSRGVAYCDEEGKLKSKPFNERATRAWMASCPAGDPNRMQLVGPVVFVAKESTK